MFDVLDSIVMTKLDVLQASLTDVENDYYVNEAYECGCSGSCSGGCEEVVLEIVQEDVQGIVQDLVLG